MVTKVKEMLSAKKAQVAAAAASASAMLTVNSAYAANDIKTMIEKSLNVVFGVLVFGGVINIVLGVRGIAKGVQDDGGGQDAQAVAKGRGQLIAGIIMVLPVPIITLITGASPSALVSSFFS